MKKLILQEGNANLLLATRENPSKKPGFQGKRLEMALSLNNFKDLTVKLQRFPEERAKLWQELKKKLAKKARKRDIPCKLSKEIDQ